MPRALPSLVFGLFERFFDIRPREFWRVQLFFALLTVYSIFYTMGATTGDTLFLSRYGAERAERLLPWVYVATGLVTVAVTWLYERLEERIPRGRFVVAVNSILAASVFLFRWAIRTDALWLYFVLVVWLEACALVALMLFFSYAGDYFTTRDARRLYGYVNGGIAVGSIAGGFAVEPLVRLIGDNNLLYICAGLLVTGGLLCMAISVVAKPIDGDGEEDGDEDDGVPLTSVLRDPFLRIVIVLVLASQACGWLVDFQLKVIASRQLQEEALAIFFGRFYSYLGATQFVVQFALVGWLLRRFGVVKSLTVLPALLVVSCGAFFVHPVFAVAVAANFARLVFLETLDEPGQEMLFLPLASRLRVRAQSFVEGMVLPLGISLAGVLLVLLAGVDVPQVAFVSTLLGGAWLACAVLLLPRYRRMLASSLTRLGLESVDVSALLENADCAAALTRLLEAGEAEEQLLGLDLCSHRRLEGLAPQVRALVSSPSTLVAAKALRVLAEDPGGAHLETLAHACADPRPEVRAGAIEARLRSNDAAAAAEWPRWMEDESAAVRLVILSHELAGASASRRAALERLSALVESGKASERALAARVLNRAPRQAGALLSRLLVDDDLVVRRALAEGAADRPRPELVGWLVRQLREARLRPLAVEALSGMGLGAVAPFIEAIADRSAPPADRCLLVRLLGGFGELRAVKMLWELVDSEEDALVRAAAARTLVQMRLQDPGHDLSRFQDDGFFERRLPELSFIRAAIEQAGAGDASFASILLDHARLETRTALLGLGLRYGVADIDQAATALFSGTEAQRANALELLDGALPRELSSRLLGAIVPLFVEPAPGNGDLAADTRRGLEAAQPFLRAAVTLHRPGDSMNGPQAPLERLMSRVAFLKRVSLFDGVDAHHLLSVARIVEERSFYAGEVLFSEGGKGDSCYLIQEGAIVVHANGRRLARLGPGECVGEMSLIDNHPRSATATAEGELRVFRLGHEAFNELLLTHPEIAVSLLKRMSGRVRESIAAAGAPDAGARE